MNPAHLKEVISNYVALERSRLDSLELFNCTQFQQLTFDNSQISSQTCEEFVYELSAAGTARRPVLYYFNVLNDIDPYAICDVITQMKKSPGKSERALPKVNSIVDAASKVLYVGKTEKNFPRRFKEHLGYGSPATFALNFIHWRTDLKIALELNYACIDEIQVPILESVESALHYVMKPMLGRSGR
jgi:hypothetical protein